MPITDTLLAQLLWRTRRSHLRMGPQLRSQPQVGPDHSHRREASPITRLDPAQPSPSAYPLDQ